MDQKTHVYVNDTSIYPTLSYYVITTNTYASGYVEEVVIPDPSVDIVYTVKSSTVCNPVINGSTGTISAMSGNPYSNISGVSVSQSGADVTVSYTVNN